MVAFRMENVICKAGKNEPKLPFFIQWNETDEERRNDLHNIGTITEHKTKYNKLKRFITQ